MDCGVIIFHVFALVVSISLLAICNHGNNQRNKKRMHHKRISKWLHFSKQTAVARRLQVVLNLFLSYCYICISYRTVCHTWYAYTFIIWYCLDFRVLVSYCCQPVWQWSRAFEDHFIIFFVCSAYHESIVIFVHKYFTCQININIWMQKWSEISVLVCTVL